MAQIILSIINWGSHNKSLTNSNIPIKRGSTNRASKGDTNAKDNKPPQVNKKNAFKNANPLKNLFVDGSMGDGP